MSSIDEKKGPETKSQVGKFQVSLWRRTRVIAPRNDYETERSFEEVRALVQHSRFNRSSDTWDTQRIWCHPDGLRDLMDALFDLTETQMDGITGKKSQSRPAPSPAVGSRPGATGSTPPC